METFICLCTVQVYSSLNTIASTWKSICEPHQKKKSVRTCKTGLKSGGLNGAVRQKLILCSLVYFPSFCTEWSCYTAVHFLIKTFRIILLYCICTLHSGMFFLFALNCLQLYTASSLSLKV